MTFIQDADSVVGNSPTRNTDELNAVKERTSTSAHRNTLDLSTLDNRWWSRDSSSFIEHFESQKYRDGRFDDGMKSMLEDKQIPQQLSD